MGLRRQGIALTSVFELYLCMQGGWTGMRGLLQGHQFDALRQKRKLKKTLLRGKMGPLQAKSFKRLRVCATGTVKSQHIAGLEPVN